MASLPMNPAAVRLALIIGGLALATFLVGFVLLGILAGCSRALPPEPAITCTVTATADAARP
jgi:Na+/H+ antiporter NhaC